MRAKEIEQHWREVCGLSRGLHQVNNAAPAVRRKFAECPHQSKLAKRYAYRRDKRLGKMGAASCVRHIDPLTGEVMVWRWRGGDSA